MGISRAEPSNLGESDNDIEVIWEFTGLTTDYADNIAVSLDLTDENGVIIESYQFVVKLDDFAGTCTNLVTCTSD